MLSICIPIYNFDVKPLVEKLASQIESVKVDCEIVLIDDFSNSTFRKINSHLGNKHLYIELEKNVGRASIRNLFLKHTKYEYLLFLDCDSLVAFENFIEKYIQEIQKNKHEVLCGGRIYNTKKPERNKILNWKYGIKTESKNLETRTLNPYLSFMTNNFVIKRDVFEKIKFDERLTDYGHEDTLFGFNLQKYKIKILQIDNPILNGDIELNHIFLMKTEKGILNLIKILKYVSYENQFTDYVKLLSYHKKIKNNHLSILFLILFIILKPILKLSLHKGCVNLHLFNFYKLGYLIQNSKN